MLGFFVPADFRAKERLLAKSSKQKEGSASRVDNIRHERHSLISKNDPFFANLSGEEKIRYLLTLNNGNAVEPVLSGHPWGITWGLTNCSDKIVWQRRTLYRNGLTQLVILPICREVFPMLQMLNDFFLK